LQITYNLPFLRTILQSLLRFFMDVLTFMAVPLTSKFAIL